MGKVRERYFRRVRKSIISQLNILKGPDVCTDDAIIQEIDKLQEMLDRVESLMVKDESPNG